MTKPSGDLCSFPRLETIGLRQDTDVYATLLDDGKRLEHQLRPGRAELLLFDLA